jgi:hypothetical protein
MSTEIEIVKLFDIINNEIKLIVLLLLLFMYLDNMFQVSLLKFIYCHCTDKCTQFYSVFGNGTMKGPSANTQPKVLETN